MLSEQVISHFPVLWNTVFAEIVAIPSRTASRQPEFATFKKFNSIRIFLHCFGRKGSVVQKGSYDIFHLKLIEVIPL